MIHQARELRTRLWNDSPDFFLAMLDTELRALGRSAQRAGLKPAARLNVFSDIAWETKAAPIFGAHRTIQFFDYTKNPRRMADWLVGKLPPNYHLVFSASEENRADCRSLRKAGASVALVTEHKAGLLRKIKGAVDGDLHDLTFLHPRGSLILLYPKGSAVKDTSGFVDRRPITKRWTV